MFGMNDSRHNTGGQDGDVHWAEAAETAHHRDCYGCYTVIEEYLLILTVSCGLFRREFSGERERANFARERTKRIMTLNRTIHIGPFFKHVE